MWRLGDNLCQAPEPARERLGEGKENGGENCFALYRFLIFDGRVYILREFLLKTYNNYLKEGSSVLDVAGGKGDLSWLLKNFDGINSIVVDPRITKHDHLLKSINYLKNNPAEAQARATPNLPTYQPLAALLPKLTDTYRTPGHLRIFLDADLVEAVKEAIEWRPGMPPSRWPEFWEKATTKGENAETLGYREKGAVTTGCIMDADEALQFIISLDLIVGFHPDQATEACIDLALLLNVPFCVCPCCVFPAEFPDRRTPGGKRVRKYDEFIRYLETKSPKVRKATLEFPLTNCARNTVLFSLP